MQKIILPDAPEIEATLLGTCMHKPSILAECLDTVKEEYFRQPGYAYIWRIMRNMFVSGRDVTPATVMSEFTNEAQRLSVQSISDYVSFNSADDIQRSYVGKLRDCYHKRSMIMSLTGILDELQSDESRDSDAIREAIEGNLCSLDNETNSKGPSLDGWDESLKQIETAMKAGKPVGISTGFRCLDDIIGGLGNSNMIVLGGRPGMGKTSLAVSIAEAAAIAGHNVYFSSLEMSRQQINSKRQSMLSGVPASMMYSGKLSTEEYYKLAELKDNRRFFVDDQAGVSPETLLSRARRLKKSKGLGLVVTDYMQLMRASGVNDKDNQVARITQISNRLKEVAKELDVPVLVLSQLSRAVEQREDKRPMLSDLRESGAIEQDADVVMFCYRDEYYLEREKPIQFEKETDQRFSERLAHYSEALENSRGKADVIVAKNRHGPIGVATMKFDTQTTAFREF